MSHQYYINMTITDDLMEMGDARKAWLAARLAFDHMEAERQMTEFVRLKNIAYGKLRKEYASRGIPFNRAYILRMLSI